MEGHCSTGQSPQWAVVPMEEEEDKIKKNEMDAACGAYWRGERRVQGFSGETGGKETTWETQA